MLKTCLAHLIIKYKKQLLKNRTNKEWDRSLFLRKIRSTAVLEIFKVQAQTSKILGVVSEVTNPRELLHAQTASTEGDSLWNQPIAEFQKQFKTAKVLVSLPPISQLVLQSKLLIMRFTSLSYLFKNKSQVVSPEKAKSNNKRKRQLTSITNQGTTKNKLIKRTKRWKSSLQTITKLTSEDFSCTLNLNEWSKAANGA